MKTKQMMVCVLAAVCAMALAGEASARGGKGNGAAMGTNATATQACATTGTTTRPTGSQRRDGTFLTTGTTASGATTRPGRGNGVQDGSNMTPPTVTVPAAAAAQ